MDVCCCSNAGESSVEVKTEVDNDDIDSCDITEYQHDDRPTAGRFWLSIDWKSY